MPGAQLHQRRELARQHVRQMFPIQTAGKRLADRLDHTGVIVPAAIEEAVHQPLHALPRPVKAQTNEKRQSGAEHHLGQKIARQEAMNQQEWAKIQNQHSQRQ